MGCNQISSSNFGTTASAQNLFWFRADVAPLVRAVRSSTLMRDAFDNFMRVRWPIVDLRPPHFGFAREFLGSRRAWRTAVLLASLTQPGRPALNAYPDGITRQKSATNYGWR